MLIYWGELGIKAKMLALLDAGQSQVYSIFWLEGDSTIVILGVSKKERGFGVSTCFSNNMADDLGKHKAK